MVKPFQLLPFLTLLGSASLSAQSPHSTSVLPDAAIDGHPSFPPLSLSDSTKNTTPLATDSLYQFSVSGGVGVFFLSFDQRSLFAEQLQSFVSEARKGAATALDSSAVKSVPFQQVDLFFPVHLAFHYHPLRWLSLGAGTEWKEQSQEALLLSNHGVDEFIYSISVWSGYLELSTVVPQRLISIQGGDGVRLSVRRYWLPATWITTRWGGEEKQLWAKSELAGAGWGFSAGSHFANFGPIKAFFEIEWRSIQAESEQSWGKILPDHRSSNPAKWSLGGLGAYLRLTWSHALQITTKGGNDAS